MSINKLPPILTILTATQIAEVGYSNQTIKNYKCIAKRVGNFEIYLKIVESQLIANSKK